AGGCSTSWSITVNLPRRKFLHLTAGTAALPVAAVLRALLTTKTVGQPAAVAPPAAGVRRPRPEKMNGKDGVYWRNQAGEPGGACGACHRFSRKAVVHGRRRGQERRSSIRDRKTALSGSG